MAKGVYALVVEAQGEAVIGRLGRRVFSGRYLYVGSARGPGGIKRLYRHFQVARGERPTGRWHIDSLLQVGRVEGAWFIETDQPLECLLAARLAQVLPQAIPGFGSSDCRCPGHLFQVEDGPSRLVEVIEGLGLQGHLIPLNRA